MAIDLTILEHQFFDPCWEPDDCSILETKQARMQVFCNFSQRIIAWVDSEEEGKVLLCRARIGAKLRHLKTLEPDNFFHTWYGRSLRISRDFIASQGFPASEGGAPEIEGADKKNSGTTGVQFIRQCLGSSNEIMIEITHNINSALIINEHFSCEVGIDDLSDFYERFISEHRITNEGRASILLESGEYADIKVKDKNTEILRLIITRMPSFKPQFPHEFIP